METIIKYIKLPLQYDADAMLKEANSLADSWLLHYNSRDYTGEWKAIPLRSVGGTTTQAVATPGNNNTFLDTPLMEQCPQIKAAVDSLECEKMAVRLLNLRAGAVVKEHKDPGLYYEEGEVRLHIPLVTNEKVEFFIEDEMITPLPGECWYMNFDLRHRLANHGDTDRIHLVIDCVVNDWIDKLFASCEGTSMERIPVTDTFSEENKRLMILQLKTMGTETALAIAKKMEDELNIT